MDSVHRNEGVTQQGVTSDSRLFFLSISKSVLLYGTENTSRGVREGQLCSGTTHHAGGLHRLGHVSGVRLAPENVALKALVPSVHDEGKCVDILPDAHEGQESHTTLH